ncbi:MAG: ferrous iron transport protein A [Planctomycetes bacterium]|nr:ferrous iron transport protein A [Planctomycetota bacterium]
MSVPTANTGSGSTANSSAANASRATVASLKVGGRGRVVAVHGADEVTMRLLEMGITPGVELCLLGAAPLGDPVELELRGYRLSLRKAEAARVEIELP